MHKTTTTKSSLLHIRKIGSHLEFTLTEMLTVNESSVNGTCCIIKKTSAKVLNRFCQNANSVNEIASS